MREFDACHTSDELRFTASSGGAYHADELFDLDNIAVGCAP